MPIEYDNGDTHFYDNFGEIVTKTIYPHWEPYGLYNGRVSPIHIETQNQNQALAIRAYVSNSYVYYVQTLHLSQAEELYWLAKNGYILSTGTTYLGDLVIWNRYKSGTANLTDRVKNFRVEWFDAIVTDTYGRTHPGYRKNADGSVDYTVWFYIGMEHDSGISGNKLINTTESGITSYNLNSLILANPLIGTSGLISGSYTENQYTTGFNGYVKIQDTWKNNNVNFYVKKDNSVRRFNYMWVKSDNVWRSIYRNTPNTINITN